MSKEMTIQENYSLQETIAAELFEGLTYPWEALPNIGAFIKKLGPTLPAEDYEQVGEDVWIARSATVAPTAYIHGPAIIGKEAEIRHCAFIRGNAIVGENAVVGNSTEPCWPCGACRQMLYEFAPGLTVLVAQRDHSFVKLPLSELLTHGFGPKSLG